MKWFKMQSDNLDDSFIQDLLYKFGAPGYLAYFGIISLICKENKNELTGKAEFSSTFLKQKLHISSGKLQEILRFCEGKGKVLFHFSEKKFKLEIPKILEIKDNYTAHFVATKNNVSNQSDTYTKDTDTKEEEVENSPPPRRRVEADRNPTDKPDVQDCIVHYECEFLKKFNKSPYVKNMQATKALIPIVKKFGVEATKILLTKYLGMTDPFVAEKGYPIYLFPDAVNGLQAGKPIIKNQFEKARDAMDKFVEDSLNLTNNSTKRIS